MEVKWHTDEQRCRRAKIKRLTADDRDRMVRMRAVPDDFDNVQALHSPYGAVHGIGGTLSPGEDANPSYGNHMLRPLMVDVRRQEDAYLSPTGLTPSFGGIELSQSAGLSSSDMASPLSSVSNDRFSASGIQSAAPRTSNPHLSQQSSLESPSHLGRSGLRQGPPMHLRQSIPRSTSDALHSPQRTNLTWKSEAFDYSGYHGRNTASSVGSGHQPGYQTSQIRARCRQCLRWFRAIVLFW